MAVIAGSGMERRFELGKQKTVKTEFGEATVWLSSGYYLLPRHGKEHGIPPHRVNYRANILALQRLGVRRIIATSAVGSLNDSFRVGELGLVDQFIDFTTDRPKTLFEDRVVHTDMTNPYDPHLNELIAKAASSERIRVKRGLVYVCLDGPRYESSAEIKMFRKFGGDVVGMTGVPEVVFAREAGIPYSSLVVATNWGAGMQKKVSSEEVLKVMKECGGSVRRLVDASSRLLSRE